MKYIAVTGASGFVGSSLIPYLEKSGHSLALLGRSKTQPSARHYEFSQPVKEVASALSACEQVVHLAARVHVLHENPGPLAAAAYVEANTRAVERLAEAADLAGVRRVIFMSTAKIYGERSSPNQPFEIGDIEKPEGPYACSKLEAENILRRKAENYGFSAVIVRPPLIHGPGAKANLAALTRLSNKAIPFPIANIKNKRSLVGVDNLSHFLCSLVDRNQQDSLTVNVTDDQSVSTPELMKMLAAAQGNTLRLFAVPQSVLEFLVNLTGRNDLADRLLRSFELSLVKTKAALGWAPPIALSEGIRRMVRHETHV